MSEPRLVYLDDAVEMWHCDYRDGLAALRERAGMHVDALVCDPPYGDTNLEWDVWPAGWLFEATTVARSLWCFGSFRMFFEHAEEFNDFWKYSQEVVWEKQNGTGLLNDRFRRVHELAVLWYTGRWDSVHHETQYTADAVARRIHKREKPAHLHGNVGAHKYEAEEGGPRMMRSVIKSRNEHGRTIHPTQKPLGIVSPLIQYSVPIGGTVVDLFGGSGTTAVAARMHGRKAIVFEANLKYADAAARRLSQQQFEFDTTTKGTTHEQ